MIDPTTLEKIQIDGPLTGYTRHRRGGLAVVWRRDCEPGGKPSDWRISITHERSGLAVLSRDGRGRFLVGSERAEAKLADLLDPLLALGDWTLGAGPEGLGSIPGLQGAIARIVEGAYPREGGWALRSPDARKVRWFTSEAAARKAADVSKQWATLETWAKMPDEGWAPHRARSPWEPLDALGEGRGKLAAVEWGLGQHWTIRQDASGVSAELPEQGPQAIGEGLLGLAYSAADAPTRLQDEAADPLSRAWVEHYAARGLLEQRTTERGHVHWWPTLRGLLAISRTAREHGSPYPAWGFSPTSGTWAEYRRDRRSGDRGRPDDQHARLERWVRLLWWLYRCEQPGYQPECPIARRYQLPGAEVIASSGSLRLWRSYSGYGGRVAYVLGRLRPCVPWAPTSPPELVPGSLETGYSYEGPARERFEELAARAEP